MRPEQFAAALGKGGIIKPSWQSAFSLESCRNAQAESHRGLKDPRALSISGCVELRLALVQEFHLRTGVGLKPA